MFIERLQIYNTVVLARHTGGEGLEGGTEGERSWKSYLAVGMCTISHNRYGYVGLRYENVHYFAGCCIRWEVDT